MAYHLHLPPELVIQDMFHASLLKTHHASILSCPAPIVIADIDADKYKNKALLYHCTWKCNLTMKSKYLVK